MKELVNKWNGKTYFVQEIKENSVVLKRQDGSSFEISLSECHFSYRKNDKNN